MSLVLAEYEELRRGQRVDRGSTPDLRVHEAVGVGPNNTDAIDDHYALDRGTVQRIIDRAQVAERRGAKRAAA